jgi:hypothetical protein
MRHEDVPQWMPQRTFTPAPPREARLPPPPPLLQNTNFVMASLIVILTLAILRFAVVMQSNKPVPATAQEPVPVEAAGARLCYPRSTRCNCRRNKFIQAIRPCTRSPCMHAVMCTYQAGQCITTHSTLCTPTPRCAGRRRRRRRSLSPRQHCNLVRHSAPIINGDAVPHQPQHDVLEPRERRRADGTLQIGPLHVTDTVLGHGSSTHGTTVFAGSLSGRPVAVKRMLVQFHEVARKEFDALVASDEHPNVLRCYAWERSGAWVYLALELCDRTLHDAFTQPDALGRFPHVEQPQTALTWRIASDCVGGLHVRAPS